MELKVVQWYLTYKLQIRAALIALVLLLEASALLGNLNNEVTNRMGQINNCPNDIVVLLDGPSPNCTKAVSWTEPTATPPGQVNSFTSTHNPGDQFPVGTTTVVYTANFKNGTTETCAFDVTVNIDPDYGLYNRPSSITIDLNSSCNQQVVWGPPETRCGVVLSSSANPGDMFDIGTTTVTYVATLDGNIIDIYSFNITLNDNIDPVIQNCPTNRTVSANVNCEARVNWLAPTATDNCTDAIILQANIAPGSIFPLGTTQVIYTAEDEAGNTVTCSFNVTVEDNLIPVFNNIPTDVSLTAAGNCEASYNWSPVTATDNCDGTISAIASINSGATFSLGTTNVTFSATDTNGNVATGSFNVTVIDESSPTVLSCPENIDVNSNDGCSAPVSWAVPVFEDACDSDLTITSTHAPGASFNVGTTIVTYTARDDAGNQVNCSFSISVFDNTSPVFTSCVDNITLTANDNCEAVANWTLPTATDACDGFITPVSNFSSGDSFPLGVTNVRYLATDEAGNQANCAFNVTVIDERQPVLISCVEDIVIAASANCEAEVFWDDPVFEDCSALSLDTDLASGSIFSFGTRTVTYTATDSLGFSTSCSFDVTVVDSTAPQITACPEDIIITVENSCEAIAEWDRPQINDECGDFDTSVNFNSGDTFPVGTTAVRYTFTDLSGNSSECSFNVIVENVQQPEVMDCPEAISVETDNSGTAVVRWDEPIIQGPCRNFSVSSNFNPGDTFSEGITEVIYTFEDSAGTTFTCQFDVEVQIRSLNIEVAQLLTPNNDGNNDNWIIEGIQNFRNNEVTVIDRWGNEIFTAKGYDNASNVWSGFNKNGDLVPTGTYFYHIIVKTDSDVKKEQGFVEIIR